MKKLDKIGPGRPPKLLTGKKRVSSIESPWWDSVAEVLQTNKNIVGKVFSIEDLCKLIPLYPDGRKVRPRTIPRRLKKILELVSRGPNRSLGRGSFFKIKEKSFIENDLLNSKEQYDKIQLDVDFINKAIDRMTKK